MQDNFNIHNWRLNQSLKEVDEATFTSKHDDDPKLKGGQKELPDELQAKIVAKEASMDVDFGEDNYSESMALKLVNALRKMGADNDKIRLIAKAMMNMSSLREGMSDDHEVFMAQNSLKAIISAASQLMSKLGDDERDIPGWIQDHIVNAENYIEQANQGFHEIEPVVKDIDMDTMDIVAEASNPEGDKLVLRFLQGIAKKFDYPVSQAVLFVKERIKSLGY